MQDIIREFIADNSAEPITTVEHTITPMGNDRFEFEYVGGHRNLSFEPNGVEFPRTYQNSPDHVERANYLAIFNTYPWLSETTYGSLVVSALNAPDETALRSALDDLTDMFDYPVFSEMHAVEEMSAELDELWVEALEARGFSPDLLDIVVGDRYDEGLYDYYTDGEMYLTDFALSLIPDPNDN